MAKIKYNNNLYMVTAKDCFRIVVLKGRLLFRRVKRWRYLIKKTDLLLLALITLIWLLASAIFATLDHIDLIAAVLSIKEEYVSSVIIVGFIGICSRASTYHEKNVEQAWVYEKTQWSFNRLLDPLYGDMECNYMPLYSEFAYNETIKKIDNNEAPISQMDYALMAKNVLRRLDLLEKFSISHRFNHCDYQMLDLYIDNCEEMMYRICNYCNSDLKAEFKDFVFDAFSLLEEIRKMWRMDLDLDCRIMEILVDNGYQLMKDYYNRMIYFKYDEIKTYMEMQELDLQRHVE